MKPPKVFADFARKHIDGFGNLNEHLQRFNLGVVPELYFAKMIFISLVSFVTALVVFTASFFVIGAGLISIVLGIVLSIASSAVVFALSYSYPPYMLTIRRRSIEANLPFATNHIGALAASGVPPHVMFKMLADATEYGEISNEAKRIVRNIEVFGMDAVSAMKQVAGRTPSAPLRQLLSGMAATLTTGGDLRSHLQLASREALSEYRSRRERYLSILGTYADFYVGVLIAAPLFFVSVLSLMSIIGGDVGGFSISALITMGIYVVIPLLNVVFILFVHLTQPPM